MPERGFSAGNAHLVDGLQEVGPGARLTRNAELGNRTLQEDHSRGIGFGALVCSQAIKFDAKDGRILRLGEPEPEFKFSESLLDGAQLGLNLPRLVKGMA